MTLTDVGLVCAAEFALRAHAVRVAIDATGAGVAVRTCCGSHIRTFVDVSTRLSALVSYSFDSKHA